MLKARFKIKCPLHFEVICCMFLQTNIFLKYDGPQPQNRKQNSRDPSAMCYVSSESKKKKYPLR